MIVLRTLRSLALLLFGCSTCGRFYSQANTDCEACCDMSGTISEGW